MKSPEPINRAPDTSLSPCHGISMVRYPILVIQDDGSEVQVGSVLTCGKDGFMRRQGQPDEPVRCYAFGSVSMLPGSPVDSINARRIFEGESPSYWLSSGYHLVSGASGYCSLRKAQPTLEDPLVPAAAAVLRFKGRHPQPTTRGLARSASKGIPERKTLAANDDSQDEVPF